MHQYISAALFVFNFLIDENHAVNFTGATFATVRLACIRLFTSPSLSRDMKVFVITNILLRKKL